MNAPYFLGIDIGTQGARVVIIDITGMMVGSREEPFTLTDSSRQEQSPDEWWNACVRCLQELVAEIKNGISLQEIKALSVTSTSGTVIPMDKNFNFLHNAIMYSDNRSGTEAIRASNAAREYNSDGYTGFNSSSGLSKMIWFAKNFRRKTERIHKWIHAADFIIGKLSGRWGITDYTNALKSGFDLQRYEWPEYLHGTLGLQKEWLPEVVAPGTPVATLNPSVASTLGLPEAIIVTVGITDGCASQIASGAVNIGDWNTTIGTTMVIKGVTKNLVHDAEGRIYSHRHPEGFWMPGGAANIGADWITGGFSEDIDGLNTNAALIIPGTELSYPLRQQGERFPFMSTQARGFEPEGLSELKRFVANMEGVAYIEKYAYELLEKLSGETVNTVYTAGGGSNSDTWLKIRTNVLNKPLLKMKYVTGAVGAAILSASQTQFNSLTQATRLLTQVDKQFLPENKLVKIYLENYQKFIRLLEDKGYIKPLLHD